MLDEPTSGIQNKGVPVVVLDLTTFAVVESTDDALVVYTPKQEVDGWEESGEVDPAAMEQLAHIGVITLLRFYEFASRVAPDMVADFMANFGE